jgi:hypothetical protein
MLGWEGKYLIKMAKQCMPTHAYFAVRLTSTIENVGLVDKLQHTIIAVKQFVNGCKIAFAFRSKMLYLCSTKVGSWPNQANSPFILPQIRVKKVKTL